MDKEQTAKGIYSAMHATHGAILRARSPDQLFEDICVASVQESGFKACFIAVPKEPGVLRYIARAGDPRMPPVDKMPVVQVGLGSEDKRGLVGEAYLTGKPSVCNDYMMDPRLEAFRSLGAAYGVKSSVAVPVLRNGASIAVICVYHDVAHIISEDMVFLMVTMADNVTLALDDFERDRKKDLSVLANERLNRMYAAQSATMAAIMRTASRDDLFQVVCDAAVNHGKFNGTAVVLPTGSMSLRYVAATGRDGMPGLDSVPDLSLAEDQKHLRGLIGEAFVSGKPVFTNDYSKDERVGAWRSIGVKFGVNSAASIPIFRHGEVMGVIVFYLESLGAIDEGMIELMTSIAENIAYALGKFDAADEREIAIQRIEYMATHDEMTGLPNRSRFSQLLNAAIEASERLGRKFAVLFIDLDRFKVINDTLGHDVGDQLLVEMANRIQNCLRADDVVARLGGDEFVVLLNEVRNTEGVAQVARNLLSTLALWTELSGQECRTTASIGIAMYPEHGTDGQTLTKRADMAMYSAKDNGKNDFRFFSDAIKAKSIEHLALESSLRHALERREFEVHYQPKVDLSNGTVSGVEALIRWHHPELGMVSPLQFVPLAEETGLIVPIGRWVLREACRQNMEWQAMGLNPVTMAVNLSPRQFMHKELLKDIDEALSDTGMAPEMLQLEVTESMMTSDVEDAIVTLCKIKERGVRIALDDFGTGFSSMALLKRFPIDTLKIDRSFVKDLPGGNRDKAVINAIIALGKALDHTVVAEGVETEDQKAYLVRQGCDEMQGYLFSKPLKNADLIELLQVQPTQAPLQPGIRDRRRIPDRRSAGDAIGAESVKEADPVGTAAAA